MKFPNSKKRNLITVFGLTFAAKILGLFRDLILTSRFGAGLLTDIFYVALNFPFLISILSGLDAVNGTSTSILSKSILRNENKFQRDFSSIFYNIIFFGSILTIFALLFSEPLLRAIVPGFSAEALQKTHAMANKFIPLIVFLNLFRYINVVFGVRKLFFLQSLGELLISIIIVCVIALIPNENFKSIPIYYLGGFFLVLIMQISVLKTLRLKLKLLPIRIILTRFKSLTKLIVPLLLVTATFQLAKIVDSAIASYFEKGIITIINLTSNWASIIGVMAVEAAMRVYHPTYSRLYFEGNTAQLNEEYNRSTFFLLGAILPVAVFFFMNSGLIMEVFFLRGSFDAADLNTSISCFRIYSLVLISAVLYLVPTYILLGTQQNKSLGILGLISFSSNIVFSIVLSLWLGYIGIPLGTVLSLTLYGILLSMKIFFKFGLKLHFKHMKGVFLLIFISAFNLMWINLLPKPPSSYQNFILTSALYFFSTYGLMLLAYRKFTILFLKSIKAEFFNQKS